ncbi:MAG: hypothetical protein ACXABY_12500 [Candidatus Thorarchaeota archaeon]|jgi:hypothetical protein
MMFKMMLERLLLLFVILFAFTAHAYAMILVHGSGGGAAVEAAACASGCPSGDGDVVCEDAEAVGFRCASWTTEAETGDSVDENNTADQGSITCTGKGAQNVAIVVDGSKPGNPDEAAAYKSIGDLSPVYASAAIYLKSEGLEDGEEAVLFNLSRSAAGNVAEAYLFQGSGATSGELYLRLKCYDGQGGDGTTDVSSWVGGTRTIGLAWTDVTSCYLYLDGVLEISDEAGIGSGVTSLVRIGGYDFDGPISFNVPVIKVDATALPVVCP